ncbi:hypothetical protein JKF63_01267 [Porcisia hertigi]|uniref:Uncharacterized protein n=1 Tax=Porcisia hertigi TaxID=2761500 RepID=A0A836IE41_9TRYP|nr:hypothetical protein JKF63_01267 [Porcisia hertigi]
MKVAPVYRRVVKQLYTACHTRPHFVQDIRFLLSFPLYTTGNEGGQGLPQATSALEKGNTLAADGAAPADASTSPRSSSCELATRDLVEVHLQRPSSECYPVDPSALFSMCYRDLHNAVCESDSVEGAMNPVATQIMRYRNLLWLQERLARVLSSKTRQLLATSLSISQGPTEGDFIPDEFFDKKKAHSRGNSSSSSGPLAPERAGDADIAGDGCVAEPPSTTGTSPQSAADKMTHNTMATFAATTPHGGLTEAVEENDPDIVYSAGAIGQQQEVFVLRHREAFPMAAQFLSGFPTITASELASCAYQRASLTQLVQQKLPTSTTCQNEDVSLSVSLEPYDVEYTSKEHAGIGYFSAAHRQFRVRFALEPHAPQGTGAERTEVLVVNSYFVRLDMELMQLVEEVGYLHSGDVLRMLRERDYGDHFSEFIGSEVAEVLGEEVFVAPNEGKSVTAADSPDTSRSSLPSLSTHAPATPAEGSRVFTLYFANYSDAPMVLKGLLYYKLGQRHQLSQAPIRCIPLGFLLMEA